MENNELIHYGILGMRWGRRKASANVQNTPTRKPSNNQYSKILHKNGQVAVNRISQIALTIGISRVAALGATASGKKATAKMLKAAGNLTAVGFGTAMVVDLARNNIERGD